MLPKNVIPENVIPEPKEAETATELIERLEAETGQRLDVEDPNNPVIAGLLGACARMLGRSSLEARDDVPAGILLRHRMSPEYQREQQMIAMLLRGGVSPDDISKLFSK